MKRGAKGSKVNSILGLGSPPPVSTKSSITTYSGQVSPPPEHRTTTPCTFTEWQKAFVGPHHGPKFWGKNSQSTTKVTLTSHQKSLMTTYSGQMSPPPTREQRGAKGAKGSEGSEGERREQRERRGAKHILY